MKKSNKKATQFHEQGNQHFKQKEFFEALLCFNKSLCYAESSEVLFRAFANRAMVFMENKQYDLAVFNLEIARELWPSNPNMNNLNLNYRRCMAKIRLKKQWLRSYNQQPEENDHWKDIKLSYPKNPKIPFVVNNVNVRSDGEKTDKILFATESMKAGDIIAIETSMINLITEDDRYKRCCWCASANKLNLLPCNLSASLMFCSNKCREACYLKMPEEKLDTLVDESNGANTLIFAGKFEAYLQSGSLFDMDLSSVMEYNEDLRKLLVLSNVKKREKGQQYYTKIFHFTYHHQLLNYGFSLIGSLFGHSCDPNVAVFGVDNKFVFYVVRPVQKGESLDICFGTEYFYMPRKDRASFLYDNCGIICTCDACIQNYPVILSKREHFISPMTQNSFPSIIQTLHNNFNFINSKTTKGEKTKELCNAQDMVWQLVQEIGHYLSYGFFGAAYKA